MLGGGGMIGAAAAASSGSSTAVMPATAVGSVYRIAAAVQRPARMFGLPLAVQRRILTSGLACCRPGAQRASLVRAKLRRGPGGLSGAG